VPHAGALGAGDALAQLAESIEANRTDAAWLREAYRSRGSLNDVARMQSELWMGKVLITT
jgi:carboxylate-amine ligase